MSKRKMEDDARRYRWLRDRSLVEQRRTLAPAVFLCDDDCKVRSGQQPIDGATLDRQIDIAMQADECHSGRDGT